MLALASRAAQRLAENTGLYPAFGAFAVGIAGIGLFAYASTRPASSGRRTLAPPRVNLPIPVHFKKSIRPQSTASQSDAAQQKVYLFPDAASPEPSIADVGGKGFSLIRMANNGINVPPGIVLTTSFFQPWLDQISATSLFADFLSDSSTAASSAALKEYAMNNLSLTKYQVDILASSLSKSGAASSLIYAVRSSSPEEDLEGASFAGGYETVLGVTHQNLERAIITAFASCLDGRVVAYKRAHGFDFTKPSIAIVIQKQVDARAAGVGFSVNPINNCLDEIVLNSNFGLGETVVSGDVSPDQFVLDKVKRSILSKSLGSKEVSVWLQIGSGGGTVERPATPAEKEAYSLSDEQLFELLDQICLIEKLYNLPIDVEFGVENDGSKIYILQARPVTTQLELPDAMLTRADLNESPRLYWDVTTNVQGILKPMTPLSLDVLSYIARCGGAALLGKDCLSNGFGKDTALVAVPEVGRLYINASVVGGVADGFILKMIDIIDPVWIPLIREKLNDPESPYKPVQISLWNLLPRIFWNISKFRVLKVILQSKRDPHASRIAFQTEAAAEITNSMKYFDQNMEKLENWLDSERVGPAPIQLQQAIMDLVFPLARLVPPEVFPRMGLLNLNLRALSDLTGGNDAPEEIRTLVPELSKSLPGNVTVEMGVMIGNMADILKEFPETNRPKTAAELRELIEGTWPQASPSAGIIRTRFLDSWVRFLDRHGHRGQMELELSTPRFREQPDMLYDLIIQRCNSSNASEQEIITRGEASRQAAFEKILSYVSTTKGAKTATQFKQAYSTVVGLGGFRESPKFEIIRAFGALRPHLLRLGARLVAAGRLDSAEDVFRMRLADLEEVLLDDSLDVRSLIMHRNQLLSRWCAAAEVPSVIDSRCRILRQKPRLSNDPNELVGFPISSGVIRARVKVLHSADEKPLLPGEILVAHATNPGWTPLFINASGIILEIGGLLQHGALIAREYGKPCVAGIENVVLRLRDGMLVELDGTNGTVRILQQDEPEDDASSSSSSATN